MCGPHKDSDRILAKYDISVGSCLFKSTEKRTSKLYVATFNSDSPAPPLLSPTNGRSSKKINDVRRPRNIIVAMVTEDANLMACYNRVSKSL